MLTGVAFAFAISPLQWPRAEASWLGVEHTS
jgi:hypothetical protein